MIYGRTHTGLMAALADAAPAEGATVHAVITECLRDARHRHEGLSRHETLPAMTDRKHRTMEPAAVFIALPGG